MVRCKTAATQQTLVIKEHFRSLEASLAVVAAPLVLLPDQNLPRTNSIFFCFSTKGTAIVTVNLWRPSEKLFLNTLLGKGGNIWLYEFFCMFAADNLCDTLEVCCSTIATDGVSSSCPGNIELRVGIESANCCLSSSLVSEPILWSCRQPAVRNARVPMLSHKGDAIESDSFRLIK